MANYFSLLSKTIGNLPDNSLDQRKIVYERARLALLKQLRAIQPALPESEITHERLALEEAIRHVELDLVKAKNATLAKPPPNIIPQAVQEPVKQDNELFDDEVIKAAVKEERVDMPEPRVESAREENEVNVQASTHAPIFKPIAQSLPILTPLNDGGVEEKSAPKVQMPVISEEKGDADFEQKGAVHFDHPPEEKSNLGKAALYTMIGFIIAVLGLTALYLVFSANSTPAPVVKQITQAPVAAITPVQERKIDERIAQDAPVISQANTPAVAIAQNARAILFEEAPSNSQSNSYFYGQVKWSSQPIKLGSQEQMIVGDVTVADKSLMLQVLIKRNLDKTLPASHTVEITVNSTEKGVKIVSMPGVLVKNTEHIRGQAVIAQGVKINDSSYLIGLSANEADIARNTLLLKDWSYLDFPVEYDNRKRAILTLEKQALGTKVFNDVFNSWGQ